MLKILDKLLAEFRCVFSYEASFNWFDLKSKFLPHYQFILLILSECGSEARTFILFIPLTGYK
jgi:hypothetical protein